jgi:hypothetical protein
MKHWTTKETAIIAVAAVAAVGLLVIPFAQAAKDGSNSKGLVWIMLVAVAGVAVVSGFRYLGVRKRTQLELTGSQQYRQLADEYRRLADLAITAQEHTDLKLGDVTAQLDYLREQNDSLQKILKEVE